MHCEEYLEFLLSQIPTFLGPTKLWEAILQFLSFFILHQN